MFFNASVKSIDFLLIKMNLFLSASIRRSPHRYSDILCNDQRGRKTLDGGPAAFTRRVGEGVVHTLAQRGGRQREGGGLSGRVRLLLLLRGRTRSRHPDAVRLPLPYRQLLPQVYEEEEGAVASCK